MTTEIARRFPAHEGYASKRDIPTFIDKTSYAMLLHSQGYLSDVELAEMMHDFNAYLDNDHWYNSTMRGRALLMADVMQHLAKLILIEMAIRRVHAKHCWVHGWHTSVNCTGFPYYIRPVNDN